MTSRSPVLRSVFLATLVVAVFSTLVVAGPAAAAPPTGGTTSAEARVTDATVGAFLGSDDGSVTYYFEYGTSTFYGSRTADVTVATGGGQHFKQVISGLTPSTTYHYRVRARNSSPGELVGEDAMFTTSAPPPDADGDGFPDSQDSCPSVPGAVEGPYNAQGCPSNPPKPVAYTLDADEVRETSARLVGSGGSGDSSNPAFSYVFQYGTTTAYGKSTPVAQASGTNTQPVDVRQRLSGLASSTEYHFRIVVQDSNGTAAVGADKTFRTSQGPPPYVKPPNSTTTSDTVGPGGSVSTGSDPSSSDPIEAKVTLEKGGKVYLDKIKNPDRPPRHPEAYNPENPGSKITNFYGRAVQFDVVADVTQRVTVTYTIHHEADRIDGRERHSLAQQAGVNPILEGAPNEDFECFLSRERQGVHYRANGDLELKVRFLCGRFSGPTTANFYNQGWGINNEGTGPGFETSLTRVLDQGYLDTTIRCSLKCSRSAKATISPATAKALGLKSSTLATDQSGPGATLKDKLDPARKGEELQLRLSKQVRRALKRANQITVTFHMKAVGPDGQVWKQTAKLKFKMEDDSDSIN